MAIGLPAIMSSGTYKAFIEYQRHQESAGQNFNTAETAGNLISEALQVNGFIDRPEYVKAGSVLPGQE
jgi:hypothetical protein